MAFQLSPGVNVVEKDFSSIVPAVSTSAGAFAGPFQWGPILDPVQIGSENQLVERFGKPTDLSFQSFMVAANFLSYANNLLVTRTDATNLRNAVAIKSGTVATITVSTGGTGYTTAPTVVIAAPTVPGGVQAVATAAVTDGAVTGVTITTPGTGYTTAPAISFTGGSGSNAAATSTVTIGGIKIRNVDEYTAAYENGQGVVGSWAAKFPGTLGNSIGISIADSATFETWTYRTSFDVAPGTSAWAVNNGEAAALDEVHIIVYDTLGLWTGVAGATLERFPFVSKSAGAKRLDGSNAYYRDVMNQTSKYIWWMDHPTALSSDAGDAWGTRIENMTQTSFKVLSAAQTSELSGGVDDYVTTDAAYIAGYELFRNDELYDISLIPVGSASANVATYVINNVAEFRKDCMVFVSPQLQPGEAITQQTADYVDAIVTYRNSLPSSSYAVMDSGYKYQYDRYNDKYRYVALNGDIAGICARTDFTADPWFSPGGFTRGQVKNVIKLAVTPSKPERDLLYKAGVNPVVSFPGQGTVLFGDKTLLAKPSAFDRINVRRLFIVLEKSIATAAKFQLFEFNDGFTRAQFKNLVEPFLRDVQGRRGIIDFRVKCDDSNNTGEVIDRNEFVADIFIKPNRSINFITLTFVAARSAVNFDEIGG
jgi:phage tail sheath protein FI